MSQLEQRPIWDKTKWCRNLKTNETPSTSQLLCKIIGSSYPSSQLKICILSPSIRPMWWIFLGGGDTACIEWVGRGLVVTLGYPKLTKPWSIKFYITCLKVVQWSMSCLGPWWLEQCKSILKWGGTDRGIGLRANRVNKPFSMSFLKAQVKCIPSWENYRVDLYIKGIVVYGARGRGYNVGGLSVTCAAKTSCETGCR